MQSSKKRKKSTTKKEKELQMETEIDSNKKSDMIIKNFTPHEIVVKVNDEFIKYPSVGELRINSKQSNLGTLHNGIPLYSPQEFTGINKNTEFEKSAFDAIIVSMIVGEYYKKKGKELAINFLVVSPDTSPVSVIRENGVIVAVSRFVVYFDPTNIHTSVSKFVDCTFLLMLLLWCIGACLLIFSGE